MITELLKNVPTPHHLIPGVDPADADAAVAAAFENENIRAAYPHLDLDAIVAVAAERFELADLGYTHVCFEDVKALFRTDREGSGDEGLYDLDQYRRNGYIIGRALGGSAWSALTGQPESASAQSNRERPRGLWALVHAVLTLSELKPKK